MNMAFLFYSLNALIKTSGHSCQLFSQKETKSNGLLLGPKCLGVMGVRIIIILKNDLHNLSLGRYFPVNRTFIDRYSSHDAVVYAF